MRKVTRLPRDPNRPVGYYCHGTSKQTKLPCILRAGFGTKHVGFGLCKFHGGNSPGGEKQGQRMEIEAAAMRIAGTNAPPVDPGEVVLASVRVSWWNVHTYEQMVAELPTHPEDDGWVENEEGIKYFKPGKPGLYGRTYHQSGIPTGEAKKTILLQMLDEERDRAFKFAAEAVKLGIEERRIQLDEAEARRFFAAISKGMNALNLTIDQQQTFRRTVAEELSHVDFEFPGESPQP